jgi:hypothetical protein
MNIKSRYSASFTGATSLLHQEMGRILPLFMAENSAELIEQEIRTNEHLLANRETTRKRYMSELVKRYKSVSRYFWEHYLDFSEQGQRIALLCVVMKTYLIVQELHNNVVLRKWRSVDRTLTTIDMQVGFSDIAASDEFVDSWTDSTKDRCMTAILTFYREAGLLQGDILSKVYLSDDEWAMFFRMGEGWFPEVCLLESYEIERIKALAL